MHETNNKKRFKWTKAYTMLSIVAVIVALLAFNLLSDPKGESFVEKNPISAEADSTDSSKHLNSENFSD